MNRKKVTSLFMAILILVVSIQNQILAAGIGNTGQAPENSPITTFGQPSIIYDPTVDKANEVDKEAVHNKNLAVKSNTEEDLLAEARQEKQSMPVISSAKIYEIIDMNEQENKEFIKAVETADVTRLDLRKPSGLSVLQADQLLKGTGLDGLGKAFVEAEKKYQVNAYYLIAHAAWESGWGKSKISREKNNLFGYMAFDRNPYQNAHGFESKAESIDHVAGFIKDMYLDENGDFYHGPNLKGMNVKYASDQNWQKGIASVMIGLAKKTQSLDQLAAA